MKTTLGGDRLGSGGKQVYTDDSYQRSTHDIGYVWRSSMASGTLVPFMSEIALPGDNFNIELDVDIMTLPTTGPLFGSYKVQLDVFECPIRLYNGKLHMNMLNIGMDMSKIHLPQLVVSADADTQLNENGQINPSCILSYLNIRGLGRSSDGQAEVTRRFNAVPLLAYWDVYKNYYSNKQEEEGVVIHPANANNQFTPFATNVEVIKDGQVNSYNIRNSIQVDTTIGEAPPEVRLDITLTWNNPTQENGQPDPSNYSISINQVLYKITDLWLDVYVEKVGNTWYARGRDYIGQYSNVAWHDQNPLMPNKDKPEDTIISLRRFPLSNIDDMRMDILSNVAQTTPYLIDGNSLEPYGLPMKKSGTKWAKLFSQQGLGIKTYQSDLFNNWISTEWIDGTNGVNEVTAVSTAGGEFTIDALNLASKVYVMLNRIALSGGSYDDWLDAVYTHERAKSVENPIYHGSLIKELGFQELTSTTDVTDISGNKQPLGTLAGKGRLGNKTKGGKMNIKVNEPAYILGIISLTPRLDYSQGNKWDVNLETLDDLHKPALDEIGFQDLLTDQMAWFDTEIDQNGVVTYKSAGKQPAWINYMTNVNQTRGNFADIDKEMFMTLNRRYEYDDNGISDLTTYIDPSKFNQIFALTALDAQNFWVQVNNQITARRKMSAKVIPNL